MCEIKSETLSKTFCKIWVSHSNDC